MGMTVDIVYTTEDGEDAGMIDSAEGDFAIGEENTWQLTISDACPVAQGSFVYLDRPHSEFGGVVDDVETTSRSSSKTVSGRTWHGILASCVVCPPVGEGHAVLSGDANACIGRVLELCDAGEPFSAAAEQSGVEVSGYTMPRYCDAYSGIVGMLAAAGAELDVSFSRGVCTVSAVRTDGSSAYSEDVGLSLKTARSCNHLVCLGSGELENRDVVHLYADSQGRVSRTQTIFGAAHMARTYELSNAADEAELVERGTEELSSLQNVDVVEIDGDLTDGYRVGQTVTAYDERHDARAEEVVTQRIARVSGRSVSIESKVGDAGGAGPDVA